MIEPAEFASRWNEHVLQILPGRDRALRAALLQDFALIRTPPQVLASRDLPEETRCFLAEAGLPRSAAPYLCFQDAQQLPRIWQVYDPSAKHWDRHSKQRLERYCMIGSDGAGNPPCLDEADSGCVVLLDHEDGFRTRQFVNTGVPQLAESLLVFSGEASQEQRLAAFQSIDPEAIQDGCFWGSGLVSISAVRCRR